MRKLLFSKKPPNSEEETQIPQLGSIPRLESEIRGLARLEITRAAENCWPHLLMATLYQALAY